MIFYDDLDDLVYCFVMEELYEYTLLVAGERLHHQLISIPNYPTKVPAWKTGLTAKTKCALEYMIYEY